jgi:hypothetical protein
MKWEEESQGSGAAAPMVPLGTPAKTRRTLRDQKD